MPRRVLLVRIDGLLGDLVKGILEGPSDVDVVGELESEAGLQEAVAASDADFVITALDDETLRGPYLELLDSQPRVKVLAIANDGGHGVLWIPVGEVSPTTLLTALRTPDWRETGIVG